MNRLKEAMLLLIANDTPLGPQWSAFLKKNRLDAIALTDVVTRLRGEIHKVGVI